MGTYPDAIKIKPNGVAVVGVPGASPGTWSCSRISNNGTKTFFIPGGGANDKTNAKKDFIKYCGVDGLISTLNNNYQLKCEPVPTCDLCAQDSSGTETLANTMISAALMATYGLPDLCVEGTSSFTIPVSDPVAGKWSWTCSTPAGISSTCSALSQPTFSLPSFPPPNPQPSYVTHASCTPYTEADGVPASCVGCCGGGSSGCKSTWSTPINCPPGEIAVATSWTSCGVSSYECQAPPATLAGGSCSPHTVGDGSPSSCVGFCGGSGGCPSTWNCYDTNGNTTTCGPCPHGSTYVNGGTSFTCK